MSTIDRVALALVIIGALNWLLVGLASYDPAAALFGGATSTISRIVYSLVGLAGIWTINLLLKPRSEVRE